MRKMLSYFVLFVTAMVGLYSVAGIKGATGVIAEANAEMKREEASRVKGAWDDGEIATSNGVTIDPQPEAEFDSEYGDPTAE